MTKASEMACDGCGQKASAEHIAKRLRRLERATRYRPVHIGTLFFGAVAPREDSEFLYHGGKEIGFGGEAEALLDAAGISWKERDSEAVLDEFQRGGFFLAHILECAVEDSAERDGGSERLCASRLPMALARIRRSLKPKRIVPISAAVGPFLGDLGDGVLGCAILLDAGKPFGLECGSREKLGQRLREAAHEVLSRG